ncbi:MAG: cyclic nucleotide-binding domain-containing protein [Anaerolineae bacterium]|nr:cyclic nucleotide-binding domain-containing protein [Anaerolineae bacterium]
MLYGQLNVIKSLGTADERLIASRGPGEFVGELSLVNPDGLRTASVRTHGTTHVWEMSHEVFLGLLGKHKELSTQLIRSLGARLTYAHNMTIQDLHEKTWKFNMLTMS